MSAAAAFQRNLGDKLAVHLGGDYTFLRSKLLLKRSMPSGNLTVVLSGSNKWSPLIELAFYFGVTFPEITSLERRLGIHPLLMHIQQYSPNCSVRAAGLYKERCSWSVDITSPQSDLVEEIAVAVEGLAIPFFEDYGSVLSARDAIASNDPNVFGGPIFWPQLLRLDLALGDLEHFEKWSEALDPLSLSQAREIIRKSSGQAP
jgi:hypothetical protein